MGSPAYDNYVVGCIGGSAQPNASAQLLSAVEFVFPPLEIAKRFYEKVSVPLIKNELLMIGNPAPSPKYERHCCRNCCLGKFV